MKSSSIQPEGLPKRNSICPGVAGAIRRFGYGGFGYLPYDCLRGDYSYGGYYNDYYPRRERVSNRKHVRRCTARYKTYNASTDTFIGKGKRKYRCNSPYDGRR